MNLNQRSWSAKFKHAFRGMWIAYQDNSSFWIHTACALAVIACAWLLQLDRLRWSLLLLCIFLVLGVEAINTAVEELAKAVDQKFNPQVRDALDIASAGVLIVAVGAAIVGILILLPPLMARLW